MINLLLAFLTAFISLYLYVRYQYGYWKKKGIHSPEATFPTGHIGDVVLAKKQIGVKLAEIYENNKHHPYVGLYMFNFKVLLVNDLDLIKAIMVKDFVYFPDHGIGISPEHDPLSNNLFNMEGNEWKALRAKLSPTFTSSKMKYMFETVLRCSNDLESYLDEEVRAGREVDFKETLARYGTDVIGACAFGIEANSFKYKNAEFRNIGKKIFATDFVKSFKDMLSIYYPSMIEKFQLRIIPKDVEDFLTKTIDENISYRENNNIRKSDFLQLLIDMKKNDEKNNQKSLSISEITAQVFLFFTAGFETSSTTASYALHELAKNRDIQENLHQEINDVMQKYEGKVTYESLAEMQYLGQVIEETLRMYPPLSFLFRKCAKDYLLPNTNITIEKGTEVMIPILGIQRDPKIHEDPLKFQPERFSPENKANRHQFSSIPFGEGPRLCIGNRFGIMQTKLGLISVIAKYEVSLPDRVDGSLKFDPKAIILTPVGEQLLKLKRRE